MNAVVDNIDRRAQSKYDLERYEFKQLEAELYRWGRWVVRHYEHEGYSGMDIIEAFLRGAGGTQSGHRILCLDWPSDVYATHGRVIQLSEVEQDIVMLKYAVCIKEDGNLWTKAELCLKYGITIDTYRKRLERARRKIQGLPPN